LSPPDSTDRRGRGELIRDRAALAGRRRSPCIFTPARQGVVDADDATSRGVGVFSSLADGRAPPPPAAATRTASGLMSGIDLAFLKLRRDHGEALAPVGLHPLSVVFGSYVASSVARAAV